MDIPLYNCFSDLSVLDYLALLWPDRSQRTLKGLFQSNAIRSARQPVSPHASVGRLRDLNLVGSLEEIPTIYADDTMSLEIDILFEDADLVVLSKTSGVPVVPDRDQARASCLEFLVRRELKERNSKPPEEFVRPRIVHRLDRLTSGLVLVAKTAAAERQFSADFGSHQIAKEYFALLQGTVEPALVTVDCPIGPGRKGKVRAVPATPKLHGPRAPKESTTVFEVIERFRQVTLVRARPLTGRTHQIRVHAWAIGYPLAIDPLYRVGKFAAETVDLPGIDRVPLHAHRYTLPEAWGEPRSFACPLAPDFAASLTALRSEGTA